MKTEANLTQTVEQLERLNEALAALRRDLLPAQPKKFAILAKGTAGRHAPLAGRD